MTKKLNKVSLILVIVSCLVLVAIGQLEATSLYNQNSSPYRESVAAKEGDLLTIIIQEDSSADQSASTNAEQNNEINVGPGGGELDFIKLFQLSQSDSSEADGSNSQSGSLNARITVEVVEVLPNGNLKVAGTKEITVNSENQEIKVSGIVRPDDVTLQNTVMSTQIANSQIEYVGEGAIGDKQEPGILSKLLNVFF
ncbi:MAG: flagellar basal body L-ring protein FlgH [Bacillota bacterium]